MPQLDSEQAIEGLPIQSLDPLASKRETNFRMAENLQSVVLPTRDGSAFVGSAVASVLAQEGQVELIVVDDASEDDTVAIVEAFRDPRIRVFRHKRSHGLFPTLNEAIDLARGATVQLIGQDDRLKQGVLSKGREAYDTHLNAGAAFVGHVELLENGSLGRCMVDPCMCEILHGPLLAESLAYFGCVTSNIATMVLFPERIPFRPIFREEFAMAGDYMFLAELAASGKDLCYVPKPLVEVRSHGGQLSKRLNRRAIAMAERQKVRRFLSAILPEQCQGEVLRSNQWRVDVLDFEMAVASAVRGRGPERFSVLAALRDDGRIWGACLRAVLVRLGLVPRRRAPVFVGNGDQRWGDFPFSIPRTRTGLDLQ